MLLRVQPSGGIENEIVGLAGKGGIAGVKGDGRRVGAARLLDDLNADALCPYRKLFHRRRAECIAGGDNYFFIISAQYVRQLGDAGGLAGAVDARDEYYRRPALGGVQLLYPLWASSFSDVP